MPQRNPAQLYLALDRQNYDGLIKRLVDEVKAANSDFPPANEGALKEYFAVALGKGADFSNIRIEDLGKMSATSLAEAAAALPDKLSYQSRENFAEAEKARPVAMQWNKLFSDGKDEIILPLEAQAQSVDDRIAAYIDQHNRNAGINFAAARQTDVKNAGKSMDQQQIRRDPADPAKLQFINPGKPVNEDGSQRWQPGQKLGAFLEARKEWALLDDFQLENSRKGNAADTEIQNIDTRKLLEHNAATRADQYNPDSLRIVISRDPQKIGEMSSGQCWDSCMSEGAINFHFVSKDIEAGSLAAYLVSGDDSQARYPLMRQMMKPYYNKDTGEVALIPAKIYGANTGGNSRTRQALSDTLNGFVRENVNAGKSGEFIMDSRLYGDGQPGLVNLKATWNDATLHRGLITYHDSSMKEWMTELGQREKRISDGRRHIENVEYRLEHSTQREFTEYMGDRKHDELFPEGQPVSIEAAEKKLKALQNEIGKFKSKIEGLGDTERLAKGYYRETRKTSPDSLPEPQRILGAASLPDIKERTAAIRTAVMEGNTGPLSGYLAGRPLQERIDTTRGITQFVSESANDYTTATANLWKDYVHEIPTPEGRVAEAVKVVSDPNSNMAFADMGIEVLLKDRNQLKTPQERLKAAKTIIERKYNLRNPELADQIAADMSILTNPRDRMDAADIALKTVESYHQYTSEEAQTRVSILDRAHPDMEALARAKDRIGFASEILAFAKAAPAAQDAAVADATLEHAKRVLIENIPAHYDRYEAENGLNNIITNIRESAVYTQDTAFAGRIDSAIALHERIRDMGKELGEKLTGAGSQEERQNIAGRWANEVRNLPDENTRLAAVMYAKLHTDDARMPALIAGSENPMKQFDAEAAGILKEIEPGLPPGLPQATALASAISLTHDTAAKTSLENRLIAVASDEHNNMRPEERLNLLQSGALGDDASEFDLARPVARAASKLSLKYIDELAGEPREQAQTAAMASLMAKPGSDHERQAALKFRESMEQLPVEKRRIFANEAIQAITMFRNDPKNITQEIHGGAVLEQAEAVMEGRPHVPYAANASAGVNSPPPPSQPRHDGIAEGAHGRTPEMPPAGNAVVAHESGRLAPVETHPDSAADAPGRNAPKEPGLLGKADAKASYALARATMIRQAVNAARNLIDGDMKGAAANTMGAGLAISTELMHKEAAKLMQQLADRQAAHMAEGMTEEAAKLAATAEAGKIVKMAAATVKVGDKTIPVWSAVVSAGFGIYEIYSVASEGGSWEKVADTSAAALAETAGGIFGFGAGEVARQTVVSGTGLFLDEKDKARDASVVSLGKEALQLYGEAREWDSLQMEKMYREAQQAQRNNVAAQGLAALGVQTGQAQLRDSLNDAAREDELARLNLKAIEMQSGEVRLPKTPEDLERMRKDIEQAMAQARLHPESAEVTVIVQNYARAPDGHIEPLNNAPALKPEMLDAINAHHYASMNQGFYLPDSFNADGTLKVGAKLSGVTSYVIKEPKNEKPALSADHAQQAEHAAALYRDAVNGQQATYIPAPKATGNELDNGRR